MAKKNKALANAAKTFQKIQADIKKKKKARQSPPVVGKCQALVTYVRLGQDNWKNDSFEWEFKVLNGPNEGRTLKKSMSLAHNVEGDKEETERLSYKKLEQAAKDLANIEVYTLDRDDVEALEGAVLEISLWKHKDADETRWPTIYFSNLVTAAPDEEEAEEEDEEAEPEEVVEAVEPEIEEDDDDDDDDDDEYGDDDDDEYEEE